MITRNIHFNGRYLEITDVKQNILFLENKNASEIQQSFFINAEISRTAEYWNATKLIAHLRLLYLHIIIFISYRTIFSLFWHLCWQNNTIYIIIKHSRALDLTFIYMVLLIPEFIFILHVKPEKIKIELVRRV